MSKNYFSKLLTLCVSPVDSIRARDIVRNIEPMRDFAGSFHNIKMDGRNQMLIYLIPEATRKAVEKEGFRSSCPELYSAYNELLATGFQNLSNDPRTSVVIADWIAGRRKPQEFTDAEIAYICDVYYNDSVPAAIEVAAVELIRAM